MKWRRLTAGREGFTRELAALLARSSDTDPAIETTVRAIIDDVRRDGDEALIGYVRRFDGLDAGTAAALEVPEREREAALAALATPVRTALEEAVGRIRTYHEHQCQHSWSHQVGGITLGQRITPLDRVGLYVPGGKAAYPSSVLMNAIPAVIAGVPEIQMAVPAPGGVLNPVVLAASVLAGVGRVFRMGGAHAVAAMAFGTATIPKVDKIVGPGNVYVATAKRLVFGAVAIDMIAGPSEIVVVCDGKTDPEWIAMDLFSQAEHDERAQAILISPDRAFLDAVEAASVRLLPTLSRSATIAASVEHAGALIEVTSLEEAAWVTNQIAPEHLELSVADPEAVMAHIRHAGAIFLGRHAPEAFGDYCAGPNHVLPTSGTARFSSPLGVYDFQKRTSVIGVSAQAAPRLADTASVLARAEGLDAHARSAEYRGRSRP